MQFQKNDRVYRACIAEFEGEMAPVVVPGKVVSVNPQRDGSKTYHVRNLNPDGGGSFTTYSHMAGELFADPIEAMQTLVATLDSEKAKAAPAVEVARG